MINKEFNIKKARNTLLVLDYVTIIISISALVISAILSGLVRNPDVNTIFNVIFIASLIITFKGINNIRQYYFKKDTLYSYM